MIREWHLLDTGYCTVQRRFAFGDGRGKAKCHAVCGLLRHETQGWLLFDTGYAPRVYAATRVLPYSLYRRATPFHVGAEEAALNQLTRFGLSARNIETVIVSHFHADHIGGLCDFPDARFVCDRSGYETVAHRRGFDAVRRAYLPDLMPDDFVSRAIWWEDLPFADSIPCFSEPRDLFGDGSCLIVPLPGHASGQIGLVARTRDGQTLFFAADATYTARAIRENVPFHPITRLFTDDPVAANDTRKALHAYHRACPETLLLPTHCPKVHALCSR
jgi:glyoxylase-like metal-dependent hydrolase (beta-lactamase superfamily II)